MTIPKLLTKAAAICLAANILHAADPEEGFVSLMDGKTFEGWKKTAENPDTWKIEDGAFVAAGPRAHLFYEGDGEPFRNFHLKVEVMTKEGSNGGIYFHTQYQESDWPRAGFENQVNVSHGDWKKTGSLYDVVNIARPSTEDNKWWLQEIIVVNNSVTIKIDGKVILQYIEPKGAEASSPFTRKLSEGTFALQAHDPGSTIYYRNIRVKRL
ncbi:DUF1080 domain-containing protein [Roseibacillus persicicus]|uniref:3-keto-disaccharide hydrolase n=1 Tax=Roseibacillus persicicus TaxID=454148 RepID=UPI00398B2631